MTTKDKAYYAALGTADATAGKLAEDSTFIGSKSWQAKAYLSAHRRQQVVMRGTTNPPVMTPTLSALCSHRHALLIAIFESHRKGDWKHAERLERAADRTTAKIDAARQRQAAQV